MTDQFAAKVDLRTQSDFPAIVPIIKISLDGRPSLIGTGFFITKSGLLVTAKHVILDNINSAGSDIGGIGALLLDLHDFGQYLPLSWTSWHPQSDIAVSDTLPRSRSDGTPVETAFLSLSVKEPPVGSGISSRFFCHADRRESDKNLVLRQEPRIIRTFEIQHSFHSGGPGTPPTSAGLQTSSYGSQERRGELREHFRPIRDTVMLPFPVFESNLAIPGSGSGGPVFNNQGFVVGINTTGIPGSDIAYHTYISSAMECGVRVRFGDDSTEPQIVQLKDLPELGVLNIEGIT